MDLMVTAAGLLGVAMLLHLVVLPSLRRTLKQSRPQGVRGVAGMLVLCELSKGALVTLGGSLALVAGVIAVLPDAARTTNTLQSAFNAIWEIRKSIEAFGQAWTMASLAGLVAALWITTRRVRARITERAIVTALADLQARAADGGLEELPPSEDMERLLQLAGSTQDAMNTILSGLEDENGARRDPSEDEQKELEALRGHLDLIEQELVRADVRRRLDLGPALAEICDPPTTWRDRLAGVFVSTGLIRSMSALSQTLALVALVLLLPSYVGLAGNSFVDALGKAEVAVHDLAVRDAVDTARQSWASASQAVAAPLTAEDEAQIHQLAQNYQSYVQAHAAPHATEARRVGAQLARHAARQQVLADFAASHPGAFKVSGDAVGDVASAALHTTADGLDSNGRAFVKEMTPSNWARVKERAGEALRAAAAPMPRENIAERLFSTAIGGASNSVMPEDGTRALRDIAVKMVDPGEMAAKMVEMREPLRFAFLDHILSTGTLPTPSPTLPGSTIPVRSPNVAKAEETAWKHLAEKLASSNDRFERGPPSISRIDDAVPDPGGAMRRLTELAQSDALPKALRERLPEAVGTFDDVFPGTLGAEHATTQGKLAESAAFNRGRATSSFRTPSTESFVRARSYAKLRGFAKVGGVLVGLTSKESKNWPQIVDMSWTDHADGIHLNLVESSGRILRFGPFRATILQQAAAYAADGRPVAATMPQAAIYGRRVLLHPVLVDTPLGCKARHIDQFVDATTARMPERRRAQQVVETEADAYIHAWAIRFGTIADKVKAKYDSKSAEYITAVAGEARRVASDEKIRLATAAVLASPATFAERNRTPLRVKTEFYDQNLVKIMASCAKDAANSMATYEACIAQKAVGQSDDDHWVSLPPQMFSESGVREVPYAADPELGFLAIGQRGAEDTWPFDFMLQVTFETPAMFGAGGPGKDVVDEVPFEYPVLHGWINKQVRDAITHSAPALPPEARTTMVDMREFAVLQRFFRLAFNGDLGADFPMGKLAELARVKPHTPPQSYRTPRWNYPEATILKLKGGPAEASLTNLGLVEDARLNAQQSETCPRIAP
ncbi:MAG: hypothetical protein AB7G62_05035 [Magnetospirillum sp.]